MGPMTYGDISPRTAALAMKPLLARGQETMILEQLGQTFVMPTNETKTAIFRRYEALALATTPLQEGVTPSGKKLTKTDVSCVLAQFGDYIGLTDVIADTHEDPVLQESMKVLMQQAQETVETIRYNVVKAGTNVVYAASDGTASRDHVDSPISLDLVRTAVMALSVQRAKMINERVSASADYRTEPVEASYVALCHTYVQTDVRKIEGFISVKQYAGQAAAMWPNEIGASEDLRFVKSTLFVPFADAGANKGIMRSTTGTKADVFPILIFGKDAYGIVPLKGKSALTPIVKNPGSSGAADPLNQRGTVGWKTMQTSVILNDLWMVRVEVAATA